MSVDALFTPGRAEATLRWGRGLIRVPRTFRPAAYTLFDSPFAYPGQYGTLRTASATLRVVF
jgi:hypothetical protein